MKAPFGRTLFDVLAEQAERHGDVPAVIAGAAEISYAELAARANRVASALAARGIRRGDRIGILIGNRPEWLEICLGASGAGAVAVPLSTWSTRRELEFLLADADIRALFALAEFGDRDYARDLAMLAPEIAEGRPAEKFPRLREVILVEPRAGDRFTSYADFIDAGVAGAVALPPGTASSAADDGLILYTSGSSAHPKAVRLAQFAIIENGFNIGERQGLRAGDRVLLSPPLFWSYGSANALPAVLTHGATLVLQEKFEPGAAIDLIERHRCTALYTLPGMTSAIVRHPAFSRARVATLRTGLTIGSEQDVVDAAEQLGASEICNIYGATETCGNCCVTWHHWPLERRASCQGEPLPGNELRFVDAESGRTVAAGEPGLVEVRGYVAAGYAGASADQNATAFTADGFYRTGDVGRLDASGAFVFIGRSTEMIKRAGINVSPAEVEDVLRRHPGVALAGVVGVPDRERGELVVAFVVPVADGAVTVEQLLAHCRSVASKYKIPDRIEIRSALPQTPTGKLQRRDLKQSAAELIAQTGRPAHG